MKSLIFLADSHRHAFQKKSKRGIATPNSIMDLVRQRLQRAIQIDQER